MFEHVDDERTRLTGLETSFARIGEGLDVFAAAIDEEEIMGRDTSLLPAAQEVRDLRADLPVPRAMAPANELLTTYANRSELEIMHDGLRLARAHAQRTAAVLARTNTTAAACVEEKVSSYTAFAHVVGSAIRD